MGSFAAQGVGGGDTSVGGSWPAGLGWAPAGWVVGVGGVTGGVAFPTLTGGPAHAKPAAVTRRKNPTKDRLMDALSCSRELWL